MKQHDETEIKPRFNVDAQSALVLIMRVLGVVLGVVVAAALSRGLGAKGYGEFAFVLAISTLISQLADFGFTQTAVKEMSQNQSEADSIAFSITVLRFGLGLFGALGLSFVSVIWLDDVDTDLILIASLYIPFAAVGTVSALLQSRLRFAQSSLIIFLKSCLWTTITLVLMAGGASPVAVLISLFFVEQASNLVMWWLALRGKAFKPVSWRDYIHPISRTGFKLGLMGAGTTIYYRSGSVLVFHYAGAQEAGFYAAAYRFLDVAQLVPGVLVMPLLPLLARSLQQRDRVTAGRLTTRAIETSLAFSLPLAISMPFLAPRLVEVVFGREFDRAAALTPVLFLAFIFISIGWIGQTVLIASSGTGGLWLLTWLLAGISVAVQVALIPRYGVIAAAWVTVGVESIIGTTVLFLGLHRIGSKFRLTSVKKLLVLTVLCGLTQYLLRDSSFLLAVVVGGIVQVTLAFYLGLLRRAANETTTSQSGNSKPEKPWIESSSLKKVQNEV